MGSIPENRVQIVRLLHMTSFIKAEILSIYFGCGSYFLDVFPVAVRFVDRSIQRRIWLKPHGPPCNPNIFPDVGAKAKA